MVFHPSKGKAALINCMQSVMHDNIGQQDFFLTLHLPHPYTHTHIQATEIPVSPKRFPATPLVLTAVVAGVHLLTVCCSIPVVNKTLLHSLCFMTCMIILWHFSLPFTFLLHFRAYTCITSITLTIGDAFSEEGYVE